MKEEEKSRRSINEVAQLLNVNEWTIRFWANKLHILKPRQNHQGDVLFAPEDVHKIELISHLTNKKGIKLKDVLKHL